MQPKNENDGLKKYMDYKVEGARPGSKPENWR